MTTHDAIGQSLTGHLRARTQRPLVVEEIALAGSWGSDGRLDVVTLTWLPNHGGCRIDGYEVKASRADLFRDLDADKWRRYLPAVHTLTLAMPSGLAKADEIPDELGLITLSEGGRWTRRRRAPSTSPPPTEATINSAALRILRRLDGDLEYLRARLPELERAQRLITADGATEAHDLALRISGRVGDIITAEGRRAAALNRRAAALDERERQLAEAEQAASDAPRVLDAIDRLLHHAAAAVGSPQRYLGLNGATIARDALIEHATSLDEDIKRRTAEAYEQQRASA